MNNAVLMEIATGFILISQCANGQLNSTMVLDTTNTDNDDSSWFDIDEWMNPSEWEVFHYVIAGGILFFLIICIGCLSWCCCCRNKENDEDEEDRNFMNNPMRYDSEFPGAELQTFSTHNHKG